MSIHDLKIMTTQILHLDRDKYLYLKDPITGDLFRLFRINSDPENKARSANPFSIQVLKEHLDYLNASVSRGYNANVCAYVSTLSTDDYNYGIKSVKSLGLGNISKSEYIYSHSKNS